MSISATRNPLLGFNRKRARWARSSVLAFMAATGLSRADGFDTAISDLVADLMHLATELGLDREELLARAERHYAAETASVCRTCSRSHDAEADQAEDFQCVECAREPGGCR